MHRLADSYQAGAVLAGQESDQVVFGSRHKTVVQVVHSTETPPGNCAGAQNRRLSGSGCDRRAHAIAGALRESCAVEDVDAAALVADHAGPLQLERRRRDAFSAHAEQVGE